MHAVFWWNIQNEKILLTTFFFLYERNSKVYTEVIVCCPRRCDMEIFKKYVTRKTLTEVYNQYELIQYEVGVYGLIELRGIKKDYSELTFHEPLLPAPKVYGSESLINLVKDFLIADEPLPQSANFILRENWNVQGRPNQDFFVWLRYVMNNGGYLELPRNYVLYKPNVISRVTSRCLLASYLPPTTSHLYR